MGFRRPSCGFHLRCYRRPNIYFQQLLDERPELHQKKQQDDPKEGDVDPLCEKRKQQFIIAPITETADGKVNLSDPEAEEVLQKKFCGRNCEIFTPAWMFYHETRPFQSI